MKQKICKNCIFWDSPAPSFNDEPPEYYGHCQALSDCDGVIYPYSTLNDCKHEEYEIVTRFSFGCNFFENRKSLN